MTVHAELCRHAGIRIAWEQVAKADHLLALTRELGRSGRVHDAFLAPHVRRPAADVAQEAERLALSHCWAVWYPKPAATHADAIAYLRQHLWFEFSENSEHQPHGICS